MVKKRAVIVEPNRDKRLQLAAVLKGEHLQIVMLEGNDDLLTDAQNNDADLIVLRAEMDRQSGYSICNRLRSNERSAHSKIVIVATDANDPRLVSHKTSTQAADAYIVPPLGLKDLRIQAYGLLDLDGGTLSDEDIQAVEDDPLAKLDEMLDENNPLAGRSVEDEEKSQFQGDGHDFSDDDFEGAFGSMTGEKKAAPAAVATDDAPANSDEDHEIMDDGDFLELPVTPNVPSPLSQLDEEDLAFVARAFESVKDAKKAPPLPPGVKSAKDLRGPDAKIYQLREKLRERELEIAKLQEIWQQHEAEYAESARRVAEMEIDVKAAQMEEAEAKRKLKEREEEATRQARGSAVTIDHLLEEKVILEKDLIEVVASKEKNVAELRRMLASRERDITNLTATLEAEKNAHATTRAEALEAMQREAEQAAATLAAEQTRFADMSAATEAQNRLVIETLQSENLERETALKQKLEETEAARARFEAELNTRTGELAKLQGEYDDLSRTNEELKNEIDERGRRELELATQLGDLRARLEGITTELEESKKLAEAQANALKGELAEKAQKEVDLSTQLGELRVRLESATALGGELEKQKENEKAERDSLQQRLGARLSEREQMLAQKDQTLADLTSELHAARAERDTITARLSDRLKDREASIATLEKSLADLRIEKAQVDERLRTLNEERARIERSLAMDDVKAEPAPAPSPSAVDDQSKEESIPIADSDESVLFGGAKKEAG